MRTLIPDLPAELRNEIYSYLTSTTSHIASTHNLPFATKRYETSHTTIRLSAVHGGNRSLLDLAKYEFLEAEEYWNWLLAHAIEIRIAIVFKGHLNTFNYQHWDAKTTKILKKLVVKWPLLARAKSWDLRIVFECKVDGFLRAKDGAVGRIARDMTSTVLAFLGGKGHKANVRLCIPRYLALQKVASGRRFGLEEFLVDDKQKTITRHKDRFVVVSIVGAMETNSEESKARLVPIKDVLEVERDDGLVMVGKENVTWSDKTQGSIVMRNLQEDGEEWQNFLLKAATKSDGLKWISRGL